MKKYVFALLLSFVLTGSVYAEETVSAVTSMTATTEAVATAPAVDEVEDAVSAEPVVAVETVVAVEPAVVDEPAVTTEAEGDNLEFISGEVSALDESNKSLTVKLYGETENTPGEKSITVSVDPETDITDGEKDRELKSLVAGTEVDVEYDPASSKATYIFVY